MVVCGRKSYRSSLNDRGTRGIVTDTNEQELTRLRESVDFLTGEVDAVRNGMVRANEALQLARDVIRDLIEETSSDPSQFQDDLERIDDLARQYI